MSGQYGEPWKIGYADGSGGFEERGHGASITDRADEAVVWGGDMDGCPAGVEDPEKARRLIAAVNALSGVPTDLLAEQQISDLLAQVHALATAEWKTTGHAALALARIADLVKPWLPR